MLLVAMEMYVYCCWLLWRCMFIVVGCYGDVCLLLLVAMEMYVFVVDCCVGLLVFNGEHMLLLFFTWINQIFIFHFILCNFFSFPQQILHSYSFHFVSLNQPQGATVLNDGTALRIGRLVVGGVAWESGLLKEGDELLDINGHDVRGMHVNSVAELMVGMVSRG